MESVQHLIGFLNDQGNENFSSLNVWNEIKPTKEISPCKPHKKKLRCTQCSLQTY